MMKKKNWWDEDQFIIHNLKFISSSSFCWFWWFVIESWGSWDEKWNEDWKRKRWELTSNKQGLKDW